MEEKGAKGGEGKGEGERKRVCTRETSLLLVRTSVGVARGRRPVWRFNWQKRGSAAAIARRGREVIPSTVDYSKRQWSRLLAFSAKGRDFDRPTFSDIDGISSFHVCSCARAEREREKERRDRRRKKDAREGEVEKTQASTCPPPTRGHVGTRHDRMYVDEWNSLRGTSGPFSSTPPGAA